MKPFRSPFKTLPALLPALILLTASCTKEFDELGIQIQPSKDQLPVFKTDSFDITAYSVANDSVRTDNTIYSLWGSYVDPVFGKASAGFFTQFRLSNNEADFGFSPVLDSLVLTLAYNGYYGDTTTPLTMRIYEVTEDLYYDSTYYSNQMAGYDLSEIASFTFSPRPYDSVYIDTIPYPAHLRLNISKQNPAFAEKIINGGEINLADNDNFLQFIKGLYIAVDPTDHGGSIIYFNLMSSLSKLTMYYSNVNYDSLEYDFLINDECARFTHFDHYGYSMAHPLLQQQVVFNDTSLGQHTLYLQGMQGINVYLMLPDFKETSPNQGLYKAELFIQNLRPDRKYKVPNSLLLGILNNDGTFSQLVDQTEGDAYFGGVYDTLNHEYRFRITRHVQQIITGKQENVPLNLLVSGRSVKADRVMLGGPGNPESKMRLEITYTPLE